ncbi:SmORF protein [Babesia bovis T2Bo]|uniref:SmORF n=1 Tax=Babesia bovis TaxID=5865 RepID=A7AT35_BABBO|nr:SmORF protein [Babesia bovis T2Bo]EDO06096.1 SmORF protein [Babesia bovis T2Bo]|eukprot:XP_001609664.1 SmORF [Babesia bovis]
MVSFNTLPKLCVLVAFGLSATVTSAEVVPEQPKEQLDIGSLLKNEEPSTKPVEVKETTKIETQDHSETGEPPMFSVDWYLLPKPENREQLRDDLPFDMAKDVPEDCDEPIYPALEKRIRKFFSLRGLIFRNFKCYPPELPEPSKYSVEWYLLPKPQNRRYLRDKLPWHLYNAVPRDCNEPISPWVEKEIREFFSVCSVEWYLESKPINRAALRYAIPSYLAEKVPLDCNEPISPATERRIRGFFSYSEEQQRLLRLF